MKGTAEAPDSTHNNNSLVHLDGQLVLRHGGQLLAVVQVRGCQRLALDGVVAAACSTQHAGRAHEVKAAARMGAASAACCVGHAGAVLGLLKRMHACTQPARQRNLQRLT